VTPGRVLQFPADEGSHPEFRTEWWYVTGWLEDENGLGRGFQVTFFRSRPGTDERNPSAFAARQLLFAHAAVSDPRRGRLLRDERAAREGFDLAAARTGELDVFIDDWSLRSQGGAFTYRATVTGQQFELDLQLRASQPPLLQGVGGFSQKQSNERFASQYYSLPQLAVVGRLVQDRRVHQVRGTAWLDHEWSSVIMDADARGWDWVGLNLEDGGALMAFQVRDMQGRRQWAAASWRAAGQREVQTYRPEQIQWQPLRSWRSPRTGVAYPVAWRVRVAQRTFVLQPLMDDQENDARGSTGTLYWEGAVSAVDEAGRNIGRGYLELTGYAAPVRF
jgi:predicted secreted hydrolase